MEKKKKYESRKKVKKSKSRVMIFLAKTWAVASYHDTGKRRYRRAEVQFVKESRGWNKCRSEKLGKQVTEYGGAREEQGKMRGRLQIEENEKGPSDRSSSKNHEIWPWLVSFSDVGGWHSYLKKPCFGALAAKKKAKRSANLQCVTT